MKILNIYTKYILLAATALTLRPVSSVAGGFPVRPKSLLLSPSVNYFTATKQWGQDRVLKPFDNNGKFTSLSYSLYAEYGISKRFTAVASLPYVVNNYEQTDYKSLNQGFTDLEVGLRWYIANINYTYYFTLQATAIVPMYNNPALGYGQNGGELKFTFAGSGKVFGKNYYFTAENGVRQYVGDSGPLQDRYAGTFGLTLDKKFKHQLSATLGGFYSTSSLTRGYDPSIAASNKNFAFLQGSLSYGYSFTRRVSTFVSAGKFLSGRNTGAGSSVGLSFVIKPF